MDKAVFEIPKRIGTDRLYLRPYRAGDGPMLYAASQRNREHLSEYESDNVLMELESGGHAEEIIGEIEAEWNARNCFFIGIFEEGSDAWVGQIYLGPTNWELPEFVIGFVADVDFEGRGYISEAVRGFLDSLFNELGAHRVKSECHEDNIRSWRLLERCGFQREGHLRENRKNPDGSFHGSLLYGLLREEFPGQ